MPCGSCALNLVDQGGHGVNGTVVGSGPKLGHREEVEALDVGIDALGDDLL
jgi:hypothetical protein